MQCVTKKSAVDLIGSDLFGFGGRRLFVAFVFGATKKQTVVGSNSSTVVRSESVIFRPRSEEKPASQQDSAKKKCHGRLEEQKANE